MYKREARWATAMAYSAERFSTPRFRIFARTLTPAIHKRLATTLIASAVLIMVVLAVSAMSEQNHTPKPFRPAPGHGAPVSHGAHGSHKDHGDHEKVPPQHAPPPVDADASYGYDGLAEVIAKDAHTPVQLAIGKSPSDQAMWRYESVEMWRNEDTMAPVVNEKLVRKNRPHKRPRRPARSSYPSTGEFLEVPLAADYPPGDLIHDVFLMMKTGSQVQWDRLPVHMFTTFSKVPNFAIYSDKPGSMGGIEIIDILQRLPEKLVQEHHDLRRYRATRQMHREHWMWDASELQADGAWAIDKFKNMPMLHHAWLTSPDSKWFVFIDDDSFVFWENMVDYLSQFDPDEQLYMGSPAYTRMGDGTTIPFAHGGTGVVLSRGAMKGLFGPDAAKPVEDMLAQYAEEVGMSCCGDAIVAVALKRELNITLHDQFYGHMVGIGSRFQGNSISSIVIVNGLMSQPVLTWHHCTSGEIEILWEYEKLRGHGANITYSDLYRDFVLPYVVPERPHWDLETEDHVYEIKENEDPEQIVDEDHKAEGKLLLPWETKEDCKKVCAQDSWCVGWTFELGKCSTATRGIVLGRAYNNFKKGYKGVRTSGWMVDRIREWRNREPADALKFDETTKTWNDDDSTSEGWFVRQMEKAHGNYVYFGDDSSIPDVTNLQPLEAV